MARRRQSVLSNMFNSVWTGTVGFTNYYVRPVLNAAWNVISYPYYYFYPPSSLTNKKPTSPPITRTPSLLQEQHEASRIPSEGLQESVIEAILANGDKDLDNLSTTSMEAEPPLSPQTTEELVNKIPPLLMLEPASPKVGRPTAATESKAEETTTSPRPAADPLNHSIPLSTLSPDITSHFQLTRKNSGSSTMSDEFDKCEVRPRDKKSSQTITNVTERETDKTKLNQKVNNDKRCAFM